MHDRSRATRIGTSTSSWRPLKLTLKLADEHQLLLQDCGFTWFVSSEQRGVLPMMFGISSEWKKLREENPQQIKRPLNVLMLECIVTELQARVQKAMDDSKVRESAIQAGWCTEAGEWLYKTWDPIKKELVAATREPLTAATMERIIIETLTDTYVVSRLLCATWPNAS